MRTSAAGASSVHCPVHAPRSRRRFVHHVARWFAEHLVGLCKDRLSIDITSGAPQPASPCGALRHTLSGRVRGPSSWFLPTSTVCATGRFAGLLHPAADHEVHRVSAPAVPSRCRVGRSGAFPPMLALQSIPLLRSRAGVTADRCPLAVASCRLLASRPCSTQESVASRCRCRPRFARGSPGLPVLEHQLAVRALRSRLRASFVDPSPRRALHAGASAFVGSLCFLGSSQLLVPGPPRAPDLVDSSLRQPPCG